MAEPLRMRRYRGRHRRPPVEARDRPPREPPARHRCARDLPRDNRVECSVRDGERREIGTHDLAANSAVSRTAIGRRRQVGAYDLVAAVFEQACEGPLARPGVEDASPRMRGLQQVEKQALPRSSWRGPTNSGQAPLVDTRLGRAQGRPTPADRASSKCRRACAACARHRSLRVPQSCSPDRRRSATRNFVSTDSGRRYRSPSGSRGASCAPWQRDCARCRSSPATREFHRTRRDRTTGASALPARPDFEQSVGLVPRTSRRARRHTDASHR